MYTNKYSFHHLSTQRDYQFLIRRPHLESACRVVTGRDCGALKLGAISMLSLPVLSCFLISMVIDSKSMSFIKWGPFMSQWYVHHGSEEVSTQWGCTPPQKKMAVTQ